MCSCLITFANNMASEDLNPSGDENDILYESAFDLREMEDEDDPSTGDKLQLRLLLLGHSQRSQLMQRQLSSFNEKITQCFDAFDPKTLLSHVRALASLPNINPIVASSIHSLARLRTVVQQQLRKASMRSDGSIYFTAQQQASAAARCTHYFVWFFEFMDYLNELHSNFVERIFIPLFKFFHDITFLGSHGRTSTSGSTFSKFSRFSIDSGDTDDNDNVTVNDADDSVEAARHRTQSRSALILLSKEFVDIKDLYDTTEVDNVTQRLSFLKEQIDYLMTEEDEVDPDLFSSESGLMTQHFGMDEGTENLVRLPLDILVKFRKALWLSRKWLELDDKRTRDVNEKLHKVLSLEDTLSKRLSSLDNNIVHHEKELDEQTNELHRLLQRENRADVLGMTGYEIEKDIKLLHHQIQTLRKQRDVMTTKVVQLTQAGHSEDYRRLKVEFQKNRLQRFILERRLATLHYQRQLVDQDQKVELHVRPSLIRHTNHVQDTCERLEEKLRHERRQRDTIRSALLPIREDRRALTSKIASFSPSFQVTKGLSSFEDPRVLTSKTDAISPSSSIADKTSSSRLNYNVHKGLRIGEAKYIRTYQVSKIKGPYEIPTLSKISTHEPPKSDQGPGWVSPVEW